VFYAIVDLLPCPHKPIFEVFQDIDLPGFSWGILFPAAPIGVIVEIVLPWAGLKDLIPGFGPGEFVANFVHWEWRLSRSRRLFIPVEVSGNSEVVSRRFPYQNIVSFLSTNSLRLGRLRGRNSYDQDLGYFTGGIANRCPILRASSDTNSCNTRGFSMDSIRGIY
jgi:hypothetical protein